MAVARSLLTPMVAFALIASLIAVAAIAAGTAGASDSTCTTGTYVTADLAKANYANDCGQPFQSTPAFSCEWANGGFHCKGPGSASNSAASSVQGSASFGSIAPNLSRVSTGVGAAAVHFDDLDGAAGYNIYRDDSYVGTADSAPFVDSPGEGTFTYYVVAFDSAQNFSQRSNEIQADTRRSFTTPPIQEVSNQSYGVRVIWSQRSEPDGVNVYRNGSYLSTVNSPGTVYIDRDGEPGDSYHLVAFRDGEFASDSFPFSVPPLIAIRAEGLVVITPNHEVPQSTGSPVLSPERDEVVMFENIVDPGPHLVVVHSDPFPAGTTVEEIVAGLNNTGLHPVHPFTDHVFDCLLYTSPSPRDATLSRMPSSA